MRSALAVLVALPASLLGDDATLDKALAFLSREVPRWNAENRCFSCHNNGDGARGLFRAVKSGRRIDPATLRDTLGWLASPDRWDTNRGDPVISDKKLARIQFGVALLDAVDAGLTPAHPLKEVARVLARDQDPAGFWRIEGADSGLGSPVTYGLALATYQALRVLERAGASDPAAKALVWFRGFKPRAHMDLAATILALEGRAEIAALLAKLTGGQNSDGGWGPNPATPSEPFDTALALLAIHKTGAQGAESRRAIERGRAYLSRTQLESGSWTETTRPAGNQSYAQHLSTAGWTAIALIETATEKRAPKR